METGHAPTSRRSRGGQAKMDGLGGLGHKTTVQAGTGDASGAARLPR